MVNLCKHCKLVNPSAGTRLVTKGAESEQHHSSATVVILCRGLCWSPCASACARCWSPADVRDLGLPSVVKAPSPSSSSAWSLAVGRAEGQVLARRKSTEGVNDGKRQRLVTWRQEKLQQEAQMCCSCRDKARAGFIPLQMFSSWISPVGAKGGFREVPTWEPRSLEDECLLLLLWVGWEDTSLPPVAVLADACG